MRKTILIIAAGYTFVEVMAAKIIATPISEFVNSTFLTVTQSL